MFPKLVFSSLFVFCLHVLYGQNTVRFYIAPQLTSSTVKIPQPDPKIKKLLLPNLSIGLEYTKGLSEKNALGLAAQANIRGFQYSHVEHNAPGTITYPNNGQRLYYVGLAPLFHRQFNKNWSAQLALPLNYLVAVQTYNRSTLGWEKPQLPPSELYWNRFDAGLDPRIEFQLTERFALSANGYFGFLPALDVVYTDMNGEVANYGKDRNWGIGLGLLTAL